MWNNKKCFWFFRETGGKCSGKWRVHKPRDCKGIPSTVDRGKTRAKNGGKNQKADALKIPIVKESLCNKVAKRIEDEEDSDYK
jgi:hypothetical protein